MMEESTYRQIMKSTLDRVEKAFEEVDPDVTECSVQFGALTLVFSDGTRCILSAQPSVRQLWMAVASKGIALHFNWNAERQVWLDDKTGGIELLTYLQKFLKESVGVSVHF